MAKTKARRKKVSATSRAGPRPIWRGHINFGLVQVPIILQPAEARQDLQFRLLDSRNHARVKYERVNEMTGEEVPWGDVVKAFEYSDDNYVILKDDDFKRAAVKAVKTIEIEQFVSAAAIRPIYFDKPYYLVPDKHGDKGYALLRAALTETKQFGISRVVIRTREYLAALGVEEEALVLYILRFAQEIRPMPADLPSTRLKTSGIATRELAMARDLIQSMSSEWKPDAYQDKYRTMLMKWIEKKARAGGAMPVAEPEKEGEEEPGRIINITELLQQSLQKQGRSTGRKRSASKRAIKPQRRSAG